MFNFQKELEMLNVTDFQASEVNYPYAQNQSNIGQVRPGGQYLSAYCHNCQNCHGCQHGQNCYRRHGK